MQRQVEVKTKARLETGKHFWNQGHCYSALPTTTKTGTAAGAVSRQNQNPR